MKTKAILTIFISLLIGFILGFIASGQLQKKEVKKRHKIPYKEMFINRTLEMTRATEEQKEILIPVISEYADKSIELKNKVSNEFDSLMLQMHKDLQPLLTEDQYRSFEENAAKMKGKFRK